MLDIMYDIPSDSTIKKFTITKEMVEKETEENDTEVNNSSAELIKLPNKSQTEIA